ncbi:phage tail tape measure protein [Massilistercora timonensis]|uniref:phage tail tape measure protein n=1 Tax=Massilistercora timonensis TaxID=2086584 RepID=UPI003AB7391F
MASDGTIKITTELDNTRAEQALSKFGSLMKKGIAALGVAKITSEVAQLGGYVVQTGIQFESAFAGVQKTVDATDDELAGFRQGIRDMAKEIPQTAAEISSVAEAAGQLGIKNEYLLSFSRTMSDLGVATNMSATEAATALARLANITQMPQENFGRLGSTIVALGNNLATTESEITEMGLRLAGAGSQVGMTEAQILGLAGAISSVGIEADAGGSAVSTVMTKMQLAVEQGGESLEQFANVAGMSAAEFQQAFREDAAEALVSFVEGLGNMESRGQSAIATLADMEITEIRQRDALLRLAGAGNVLSESLGIATQAWDENNALTNEAEQRYQTLESQLQILKNNIDDFAISLYDGIRDPMAEVVSESIGYVQRLHDAFSAGGLSAVVSETGEVFNDVADDIAGTSQAAAGLVNPLRDVANVGGNLARTVLPVLGDGAKFTAENFDAILPVLTGVVAGYKLYNTIGQKTATVLKASTAATAALNKMEKANALLLVAQEGGLTTRQTLMALYNKQIPVTTAATGLWTKAQTALNTAMNANPIGVAVAGATALIAVGTAIKNIVTRETEAEREHSQALKESAEAATENRKAAEERKQAYEELVESQNTQAAGDVAQLDRLRSLNNELNTIVDANGRVKAGEEDRAAFITSQLSDALGVEISMTDGVINNYQELRGEIQSLIQQKRVEAVMSAQQAKYEEAVANQMQVAAEASANLTAMKQAENDVKRESAELSQLEEDYNQAVLDGNKKQVSILGEKIKRQEEDVAKAKEAYEENKKAYEGNSELLAQYANDIDMYTALAEAAATGNAEAIEAAISQITAGIKTASNATSEELQQQVVDVANMENLIRQEVEKGTPGFTQSMLTQAQSATTAALEEFAKAAPQTAAELAKVPPEAVAALVAGDMRGQLSAEASGAVDGMLEQFDSLDDETREAFAQAIYGALEGLEGFDQLKDPAEEGVEAFLESLRTALDEHSPSKKTEEIFRLAMEGAAQGIESGKEGVLTKAGEFVAAFLAKFTGGEEAGGLSGKLQGIGSAAMNKFGIGAASQTKNSQAAGKANADAANKGAASVNPTGTGSKFGGQYNAGVSGMSGAARGVGTTLGKNANAGAGSVTGTGTGGKFGSQYASGVGGKSGEARTKGSSLGRSAESGAGSYSGYGAGSDFGSGFVRGIGSWIGSAASKAASLAKSAFDAAKKWLDAHSPSRKSRKLGRWFGQGFTGGIEDEVPSAEKASQDITQASLDGLDTKAISEKLKGLDLEKEMANVYFSVDSNQARVADNIVSAVSARESQAWKSREQTTTVSLSDEDIKKLAREFASIVSTSIANELDGMGIYAYEREFARVIRRSEAR